MPWLRFTADFPFHVRPNVTQMYRVGEERLVKQACADQALAKGSAVKIKRPPYAAAVEEDRDERR